MSLFWDDMFNNKQGETMTKMAGLTMATLGGLAILVHFVRQNPSQMWLGGGIAFVIIGLLFAFSESSKMEK